jgi:hypothetical protein
MAVLSTAWGICGAACGGISASAMADLMRLAMESEMVLARACMYSRFSAAGPHDTSEMKEMNKIENANGLNMVVILQYKANQKNRKAPYPEVMELIS